MLGKNNNKKLGGKIEEHVDSKNRVNWYADKHQWAIVQRNIFLLISVILLCVTLFSLFILKNVTERKSVVPFVVRIDKATGIATSIDNSSASKYTADQMVQRYFLYQYLKAREEYDIATYQYNYFVVSRLMSTSSVYNEFLATVSSRNENSPVNLYGRNTKVEIDVKSVQYLKDDTVQFRILKKEMQGNAVLKIDNLIILIEFTTQSNINLTFADRLVNPLGFIVTKYEVENEIIEIK